MRPNLHLSSSAGDRKRRQRSSLLAVSSGLILGLLAGWAFLLRLQDRIAAADPAAGAAAPGAYNTLAPGTPGPSRGGQGPAVGAPAPDFTLETLEGGSVTLSGLRGRPVLINFWASWCAPCRLEMPDLVRAYETHKDRGFVLLGINLTFQDLVPEVRAFVEEFKMTFPVLFDTTGEVTVEKYQLLGLPLSIFVDRQGTIRRIHIGAMTSDQIDEYVLEILE